MKRFCAGFFVVTTLLVSSGCSSTIKSDQTQVPSHKPSSQAEKQEAEPMNHDHHVMENIHDDHPKISTRAKLTALQKLAANSPINLVIDIQDATGKPVNKFDIFQEKIMHLIVVSDDLQFFDHIHPEYKENGRFQVSANFPESGNYTFFSDYKPSGQKEDVSLMNITIPGSVPLPKSLAKFSKTKTFSDTKVNLNISQPKIKVDQEISLIFDLKDNKNQPIKDLKPYLGEKGHLVIIKSSLPLTKSDYIHVHSMKNTPDGQVQFMTKFPQTGTYKMWMQFDRNGKVKTADFWVNVE